MFDSMYKGIGIGVILFAIFIAGVLVGTTPVTKQEIVETTDSLQTTMLEALEASKDK